MQTQFMINVPKAQASFDLDFAKLPAHVQDHVLAYGVRQILNDAAASAKTADEAKGMVEKRLKNLTDGTLRASVGRASDPVAAEAKRIATDTVTKAAKAKGKKLADVPNASALIAEVAARASVIEQAKAIVALRGEGDIEVTL